jgi:hypothetical protein
LSRKRAQLLGGKRNAIKAHALQFLTGAARIGFRETREAGSIPFPIVFMERGREGQVPFEQLRRTLTHHAEAILGVRGRIIGSYLDVVIAHRVCGRATWRSEAIGYEAWR